MRTLLFPLLLVACGSPAWRAAVTDGSAAAYEQFARENPESGKAPVAEERADALRYTRAKEADTAAAWSAYLRTHTTGTHAAEAVRALDDAAYREAVQDKDALALERYLSMFPAGAHTAEASGHLDAVRWREATDEDTATAYQRYALQEPDGDHVADARRLFEERWYDRAAHVDTVYLWRRYLERFDDGSRADGARARLGELTFDEVEVVVALGRSWQDDRAAALKTLTGYANRDLVAGLRTGGFRVAGSVRAVDLGPEGVIDAERLRPTRDGIGAVVVVLSDAQGEAFEPSGFATSFQGDLRLYVRAKEAPLASWPVTAATPDEVSAPTVAALYTSAAQAAIGDAAAQVGRVRPWHPTPP